MAFGPAAIAELATAAAAAAAIDKRRIGAHTHSKLRDRQNAEGQQLRNGHRETAAAVLALANDRVRPRPVVAAALPSFVRLLNNLSYSYVVACDPDP